MRVEISIAKEKVGKMPKGATHALKEEMTQRISKQYDDVEMIVKTTSNDSLSVMWAADKETAREFIEETLQDTRLMTGLCAELQIWRAQQLPPKNCRAR